MVRSETDIRDYIDYVHKKMNNRQYRIWIKFGYILERDKKLFGVQHVEYKHSFYNNLDQIVKGEFIKSTYDLRNLYDKVSPAKIWVYVELPNKKWTFITFCDMYIKVVPLNNMMIGCSEDLPI